MRCQYVLTLSTATESSLVNCRTTWTLTSRVDGAVIGTAICKPDPHGDHARVEGRAKARAHALAVGQRIKDTDVRVVYAK